MLGQECELRCIGREKGRGDSFTAGGFNSWNKKDRLAIHVGPPNSAHNYA